MHSYKQSFGAELSPLTTPIVNISPLSSATQAALLLQGIAILGAYVGHASLENDRTKNSIKLLTTPGSLQGSLHQMGAKIKLSFRDADRVMKDIKAQLDYLPGIMMSIIRYRTKPEDQSMSQIKEYGETLRRCSEKAAKARQGFDDTMLLIQEMINVAAQLPEEMHKYQKIVKMFEEIQLHLSVFLKFFPTLESAFNGPMKTNLETIEKFVKERNPRNAGILQKQIESSAFKEAAFYHSVSKAVDIYNQNYMTHVRPHIDGYTRKLTMPKKDAEKELDDLDSKIQQFTKESNKFLHEKLQEAEKDTVNQMRLFRDEIKAVLGPSSR